MKYETGTAKKTIYTRFSKLRIRKMFRELACRCGYHHQSSWERDAFMHSWWSGGCFWGAGNIAHCRLDVRSRERTGSIALFHQTDQSKRIPFPFWIVPSFTSLLWEDRLTDPRRTTGTIRTFMESAANTSRSISHLVKKIFVGQKKKRLTGNTVPWSYWDIISVCLALFKGRI